MFETSTKDRDCDNGGFSLRACLQITATPSGKFDRLWRRTLYVGIFIALRKKSSDHHGVSPSSLPAVAVPPSPADGKLSRTSSSRSYVRINVPSDSEKEEEYLGDHEEDEQQLLRNRIVRIVEEKDLDSLRRFGGIERVASVLGSHLETGINGRPEPRAWYPVPGKGFFDLFLEACNSYTIFLLLISAGLSFCIEIITEGTKYGWYDGATILFAVFLLAVANFLRARKLERKERANKEEQIEMNVIRDGSSHPVNISHIVEGDIVCLNKGDRIPTDGLFVRGDGLVLDELLDSDINCDRNPFLFYGSKVIEGQGRMIVTSVGTKTTLAKVLGLVSHDPKEKTLLEAKIEKPIAYIDYVALVISIIISLVLLVRLLCREHADDNGFPELKGEISVGELMKIFERNLLRSRGMIGILTTSLTAVVIGLQHGMPFVITVSVFYCNEKMASNQANPQNLSACATMGLVGVISTDTTGGLTSNQMEVNKSAVRDLRDAGVSIKLVSGDELSVVRAIACELGIFRPGSTDVALEGEEFRKLSDIARMEKVDEIIVMGNCRPEDKLLMVQCLKQNGHIVAFCGGFITSNAPALEEADVGITEETRSTEMARESSDFVISDNCFGSLTPILNFGRCFYLRIQKFVQVQFTAIISGLLISFITTMCLGESPITALHLIWVYSIMSLLGGLMLVMDLPSQELMTSQPAKRRESLITKIMMRNIVVQVLYQAIVLMILQFKGQAILGNKDQKVLKGLIFNSFTLCQLFNQFNAMDLVKKEVFVVVLQNYCFPVTVGAIAVMQFLVVEFAGSLANCVRLNWVQWTFCFIVAALSWGFDQIVKFISDFLKFISDFLKDALIDQLVHILSSQVEGHHLMFHYWVPFSMFLLFSLSYYFNPAIALNFR